MLKAPSKKASKASALAAKSIKTTDSIWTQIEAFLIKTNVVKVLNTWVMKATKAGAVKTKAKAKTKQSAPAGKKKAVVVAKKANKSRRMQNE